MKEFCLNRSVFGQDIEKSIVSLFDLPCSISNSGSNTAFICQLLKWIIVLSALTVAFLLDIFEVILYIKFYTEVRHGIWDHLLLLPICPADGHYASRLMVPCVRRSTVGDGRSRLLDPASGTLCRRR